MNDKDKIYKLPLILRKYSDFQQVVDSGFVSRMRIIEDHRVFPPKLDIYVPKFSVSNTKGYFHSSIPYMTQYEILPLNSSMKKGDVEITIKYEEV